MRMSDWSSECAYPWTSGHNSPMNDPDPLLVEALATFDTLFDEALAAGEPDRTAMVVATASADAWPPARTVLLDRKGGVEGKSATVRVNLGGRRSIKKKKKTKTTQ